MHVRVHNMTLRLMVTTLTLMLTFVSSVTLLSSEARGQTKPAPESDKLDYYYAKQDWDNLVKIGEPAIPHLRAALNDGDSSVRYFAMHSMIWAKSGDRQALQPLVPSLVRLMNNDPRAGNRHQAAKVLKKLDYAPEQTEQRLRFLLALGNPQADTDPRLYWRFGCGDTRHQGEWASEKLSPMSEGNVKLMCGILLDLKEQGHLPEAIFAAATLGDWGDNKATDALLAVADCSDRRGFGFSNVAPRCPLTSVAIEALGKVDAPKTTDKVIDHIAELLRAEDVLPDVIRASSITLETLKNKRAIEILGRILQREQIRFWEYGYPWSARLCKVLASFGPEALDALAMGLHEDSAVSNRSVVLALREIHDEQSVSLLVKELDSGIKEVPEALGSLGYKTAVPALCEASLNTEHGKQFRVAALKAIGEIGDESAIDDMRRCLTDRSARVRKEAAHTLEVLGWSP